MKVMIIDDDLLMLENLQILIDWNKIGMEIVCTCTNGRDALNELEICEPDIVIADISMPVVDGLEFSRQAFNKFNNLRIILLTSYSKFEYAKTAIEIGVSAYILKHELDSNLLKECLLKEKSEILKNRTIKYMENRESIQKLVLGEDSNDRKKYFNNKQMALIVACKDCPIAIFGDDKEPKSSALGEVIIPVEYGNIQLVFEDSHFIVYIITRLNFISKTKARNYLYNAGKKVIDVNNNIENVIISPLINQEDNLNNIYISIMDYLKNNLPNFNHNIIFYSDLNRGEIKTNPKTYNKFLKLIDQRDYKNALFLLDEARNYLVASRSVEQLRKVVLRIQLLSNESYICYNVNQVIDYVRNILESLSQRKKEYSIRTEKAIDYVKSNYKNTITLKMVADYLEVSPDHLGRTFKKETGKSLVEFITEYKMEIAKDMLLTGNYKVYEVSNELGYKTSQYFSIVFKKVNGTYPSDYLKGNYND